MIANISEKSSYEEGLKLATSGLYGVVYQLSFVHITCKICPYLCSRFHGIWLAPQEQTYWQFEKQPTIITNFFHHLHFLWYLIISVSDFFILNATSFLFPTYL